MSKPRITIIGLGNVGSAFYHALQDKGYPIASVYSRSFTEQQEKELAEVYHRKGLPGKGDLLGDGILITVPDDAIQEIDLHLAQKKDTLKLSDCFVVHCSGTLTSADLKKLKGLDIPVASFHPLKAVTPLTQDFEDCWFDMEGDDRVLKVLENMVGDLGAQSLRVESTSKPMLHAAAVVASNYLVVLNDMVREILREGNIPEGKGLEAILPLMYNSLNNVSELGPDKALTGPIARGDRETVRKHLELLEKAPDLLKLYKELGLRAVAMAEREKGLTDDLKAIRGILQ